MTLILSITTPQLSVHTSDRRVTLAGRASERAIYSPLENKTIIFVARDAVGTIGYTGIAFIGQEPTDQWIANILAPQPFGSPPLGSFAFGGRGLGQAKLRTIFCRLKSALAALPRNLWKYGVAIQIAGYRIRRRRSIPFCVEIEWRGGVFKIDGWMRPPRTNQETILFGQLGDGWPAMETSKAIADYAKATAHKGVDAIQMAAAEVIRKRSIETITVGSDLMTVVVPNPTISREIVWRFDPVDPHEGAVTGSKFSQKFRAVYSPWIIAPAVVSCPCLGTSGAEGQFSGFRVRCGNNESANTSGILFAISSQERRLPPR